MKPPLAGARGILAVGMLLGVSATAPLQESAVGNWVGEVQIAGTWQAASLHLSSERASLQGTLDLPLAGEKFTLDGISVAAKNISFLSRSSWSPAAVCRSPRRWHLSRADSVRNRELDQHFQVRARRPHQCRRVQ